MTSDKDTLRRVRYGLDHLQSAIHPFVNARMEAKYGKRWVTYASRATSASLDALDLYALLKTMIDQWRECSTRLSSATTSPRCAILSRPV